MEKNKIGQLCYWMTRQTEGRELLEFLKTSLSNDPAFPKAPEFIAQFGGTESYLSYKSGQLGLIRFIELHAQGYTDQQNAAQKEAEKQNANKIIQGV